jgi:ornithine decarboxylase
MNLSVVERKYHELARALPFTHIYYAMKANPMPEVVHSLAAAGSCFDVASAPEIRQCLEMGIPASRLSFGNTIKKSSAIAEAHAAGIDLFAFDSAAELEKIARHAPGARVTARLLTTCRGAEWPLSRKFGCDPEMAFQLLRSAPALGLTPFGLSFHVGSQQTNPNAWEDPIAMAAHLFRRLQAENIRLNGLNLGGGFPAQYTTAIASAQTYGAAIAQSLRRHFGSAMPHIMVEPGRYLVAEAGVIETEVVLVSRKSQHDHVRWVYLDCGKFGGLAETMDEAIRYPIHVHGRSGPTAPVVIAGPTCDSADILYERHAYHLPLDLHEGDRLRILSAGAYTHSYSSIGFNGFAPLGAICV